MSRCLDVAVARAACAALKLGERAQNGDWPRAARKLAGAVIVARTRRPAREVAKQWRLHGPELAPSMLARAGITTDVLLTMAEAVDWALPSGGHGVVPRPEPIDTGVEGRGSRVAVKPAAPRVIAASKPEAAAVERTDEKRAYTPRPSTLDPRPSTLNPRPSTLDPRPAPRPARRWPPVRPEVLRYAGWFLDARWRLETVADLFDLDPQQLLNALDPAEVAA